MNEKLKHAFAVVGALFVGIGAIVAAFFLGSSARRISEINGIRIPGSGESGTRASDGLGKLEAGQQESERIVGELKDELERSGELQRKSETTIAGAEEKLDRLDELLGITDTRGGSKKD
jgi:hypothetical protein